ncbi:signal peptidase I [Tepidanaerobacter syntrophicus]|uniref:Signal peptidase I n=2 Tax=Tepidanaerobacter syntrophicus TaxID=224999 RepID=A0A0U9HGZ9_9FIRM|nr:signal peptidase I [Tepidanaerobacter syntrophicus]GAQ24540.1 signal peptidase I [Tepidanaerobacter syntrophicus]
MPKEMKSEIKEWIKAIGFALILALLVRGFIFEPMIVPTGSMIPTIQINDRILVNKFIYRFQESQYNDIVVFRYPDDHRQIFVKRLIGKGGDTIEIKNGVLYRNDIPLDEPYIKEAMWGDFEKHTVPEGHYFMMGDNRNNSKDSRFWNNSYVSRKEIIGKATYRIWPLNRAGRLE